MIAKLIRFCGFECGLGLVIVAVWRFAGMNWGLLALGIQLVVTALLYGDGAEFTPRASVARIFAFLSGVLSRAEDATEHTTGL